MNPPRPPAPAFGLSAPSFNFDSLIDGTRCKPFVFELDLTSARDYAAGTAAQVKITGNCLMIDAAPEVGQAHVIFEGVQDDTAGQIVAPIWVRPGLVCRFPFFNLRIANHAQPGKKLRIIYGVDISFEELGPAKLDTVEQGFDYAASAAVVGSPLAASTAEQIVAPASNVKGLIVWQAMMAYSSASQINVGLYAKASAPTSGSDSDCLAMCINVFNSINTPVPLLPRPVFIAPGKGLYWFNAGGAAQNARASNVLYTLL